MTTFKILPRIRQSGYKVEIVGEDGARSTMLGFESKEQAEQWVADSMRMEARLRPPRSSPNHS